MKHEKEELWLLHQFSDLSHFIDPAPLEGRRGQFPLKKNPGTLLKYIYYSSLSQISPKGRVSSYQVNCTLEKGKYSDLLGTTGHQLWSDINSRRIKISLWSTRRVRALERSCDQWNLAQVHFTMFPVGPWTHPAITFPVPKWVVGTDTLINWQNLHISFLTTGMSAIRWESPHGNHENCLYLKKRKEKKPKS